MAYWLAREEPRAVGDLVHVEKFGGHATSGRPCGPTRGVAASTTSAVAFQSIGPRAARIGRLGVPIALEKEAEAVVAPVVAARNPDIDRRPAHQECAGRRGCPGTCGRIAALRRCDDGIRLAMEGNTPKQVCKLPAFNTEKLQSQKRSIH